MIDTPFGAAVTLVGYTLSSCHIIKKGYITHRLTGDIYVR